MVGEGFVRLIIIAPMISAAFAKDSPVKIPPCHEPTEVQDPDHMIRPKYPKQALRAGKSGTVQLQVVVGNNGNTRSTTVVSGEPVFAKPALEAVQKWRFRPYLVDNIPREATYKVEVRFREILREAVASIELEWPLEASVPHGSDPEFNTAEGTVYRQSNTGVTPPKETFDPEPEFSEGGRKNKECPELSGYS